MIERDKTYNNKQKHLQIMKLFYEYLHLPYFSLINKLEFFLANNIIIIIIIIIWVKFQTKLLSHE